MGICAKWGFYQRVIITFLCLIMLITVVSSQDENPYQHEVTLDPKGKYNLTWIVNWDTKRVLFNVTVATNGYIGFGLSAKGKMAGADIVIGGVGNDGVPYFQDRYAISNQLPEIDDSQDYHLDEAWERNNHTFLSFSRPFDTCDTDHDLPITDDVLNLLWSYGENDDELQYHFGNRGSYTVHILDADLSPRDLSPIRSGNAGVTRVLNVTTGVTLNNQDFVYWCTFHKVPTTTKQHIIGFNALFPSERDRRHVHHLSLYRCTAPPGTDADSLFEGPARSEGSECYRTVEPDSTTTKYCNEVLYVFAIGAKPIFFPDHVGLPMSEQGTEYLMAETHYDNPDRLDNLRVDLTLQAFYTSQLRKHDAGLLWVGHLTPGTPSLLLPNNELSHITMGHLAPGCTQKFLDSEINVFATYLHTHLAGRGVRALHFRGDNELPWISQDDNYNFNYQQTRILREERKVLPGDQLIIRCNYETTNTNGSVVAGGFSTRQEMCAMGLFYYNRIPSFTFSLSEIKTENYHNFLGIRNVTWDRARKNMVITDPPQYSGLTVEEYGNNYIEWNIQTREELQRYHIYEPQTATCAPNPDVNWGRNISGENEHMSVLPRRIFRYKRPSQCSIPTK